MNRNGVASDVENQLEKTEGSVGGHSKSVTRGGNCSRKDEGNWSTKIKKICDLHEGRYLPIWNRIFVISCVLAVSLDPFFFYLPIIDQDNKCLQMDKKLRTVTIVLRSLTDVIFLVHFICEICGRLTVPKDKNKLESTMASISMLQAGQNPGEKSKGESIGVAKKIAQKMSWLSVSIIIDLLALLPIPQLLIVLTKGSVFLGHKNVLNFFLLGQYLPRICRIHVSSKDLKKNTGIWVKGLFNFFLYILASHVLGAFWYFFSIQRETSCWHRACINYNNDPTTCMNTFYCNGQTTNPRNITFLNEHCPLDSPDGASGPFKFGIFLDALKNDNTEHMKFGKRFFYSFWWGLRNLSNFGINLTTSTYVWENLFAILISLIGLLLFLYLIGNVQTFMQMEATNSEQIRRKIRMKKLDVGAWIAKNGFPDDMKKEIMKSIDQILKKNNDADLQNPFSVLPEQLKKSLKRYLFMNAVKTVPMLKDMKETVLEMMCDNLKRVTYNEKSFVFRKGDPIDYMLFITEGTMWTYSTAGSSNSDQARNIMAGTNSPSTATCSCGSLGKGKFYGDELLKWASPTFAQLPISTQHVKTQTKVEAFALMAKDLATVVSKYPLAWNFYKRRALKSSSTPPPPL